MQGGELGKELGAKGQFKGGGVDTTFLKVARVQGGAIQPRYTCAEAAAAYHSGVASGVAQQKTRYSSE